MSRILPLSKVLPNQIRFPPDRQDLSPRADLFFLRIQFSTEATAGVFSILVRPFRVGWLKMVQIPHTNCPLLVGKESGGWGWGGGVEFQNMPIVAIFWPLVNHAYPRAEFAYASFVKDARIPAQDSRALAAHMTRI